MPDSAPFQELCRLDAIPDEGSIRADATVNGQRVQLAVVRKDGEVRAYVNSCPHIGAPLDYMPGQFLDVEKSFILCSNHGALFRIDDGMCVHGPCIGKALESVAIEIRDGGVFVL